jgi:hypothetical protein
MKESRLPGEALSLVTIRGLLLAIVFVGILGTGVELLLLGHFEDGVQLVPLVLLAAALVVAIWQVAAPGATGVRALQFVMVLCVAGGLVGIGYHYAGNEEFEREQFPGIEGVTLVGGTLRGATPVLAPGSMALLGLVGLTYAHRHPRLIGRGIGL